MDAIMSNQVYKATVLLPGNGVAPPGELVYFDNDMHQLRCVFALHCPREAYTPPLTHHVTQQTGF